MGLWEWEVGAKHLELNDREYELLGIPKDAGRVSRELFLKRLHPDDLPEVRAVFSRSLELGVYYQEFRVVLPDGEVRWLAAKGQLFDDGDENPPRMLGVNFDITHRKLAEETLKLSEAAARARANELAVLMDTVPAMTFIAHDPECRHISCSKNAREFLRVPEGGNVSLSASEEDRPGYRILKDGVEFSAEQLFELPVPLFENLLVASCQFVRGRDITDGAAQAYIVVVVDVFPSDPACILQGKRRRQAATMLSRLLNHSQELSESWGRPRLAKTSVPSSCRTPAATDLNFHWKVGIHKLLTTSPYARERLR